MKTKKEKRIELALLIEKSLKDGIIDGVIVNAKFYLKKPITRADGKGFKKAIIIQNILK